MSRLKLKLEIVCVLKARVPASNETLRSLLICPAAQ